MVGNTHVPTVVESDDKATYMKQEEINDLNEDQPHLQNGLGDNINNTNKKNDHDNTNLANTGLKSNNILVAHIMEEKEGWFHGWADIYDKCNNYYHTPTEENEPGSSCTFTGDDRIFKLTKIKHRECRKWLSYQDSIRNFYTRESHKDKKWIVYKQTNKGTQLTCINTIKEYQPTKHSVPV